MSRYVNKHTRQGALTNEPVTRRTGCTWTSGCMGVDAATGGRRTPTPDEVHALVKPSEETNPDYPGWSIADLDKAMARLSVPFTNRSGQGWDAVLAESAKGKYLVIQGDSDRFGNNTCSGKYDGDHCIGKHPDTKTDPDGSIWWWINDPICPTGRWERDTVIRAYAQKLAGTVYFGSFDVPVPQVEPDPVNPPDGTRASMAIRYAPTITSDHSMHLVKGQALYAAPGGARVTVMQESGDVPYLGLAPAYRGKKWRAVLVTTKGVYVDGVARPTVLYVPGDAGVVKE